MMPQCLRLHQCFVPVRSALHTFLLLVCLSGGPKAAAQAQDGGQGRDINIEHYASPWVAPKDVRFKYEGLHNNLRELLDKQMLRNSISITFFTKAQRPMLLNCVYTMVKYGRAFNYIVVTIDHTSLAECINLRLPCYNATHLLGEFASGQDYRFGSPEYRKLVHSKPAVVYQVFKLGLHIHFSDVDVTYLRRIWPSYNRLMQATGADMVFMNEYSHLNSGNFVIRYNERSLAAVRAWATDSPERETHLTDQEWLWSMNGQQFSVCSSRSDCQAVKARGLAALVLHPSQFGKVSWTGHCPGRRPWPVCASYTLYLHIICFSGQTDKVYWMKHYDLWHLQDDDLTPKAAAQGAQPHAYLPCAERVAWKQGPAVHPQERNITYPKVIFDNQDDEDVANLPRP